MLGIYMLLGVTVAFAQTAKPTKHTVQGKETLYSLSRQYGVKVQEIINLNPGVTMESGIKIGQVVLIPAPGTTATAPAATPKPVVNTPAPVTTPVKPTPATNNLPQAIVSYDLKYKYHTVQKQETLYSISRRYGVSIQQLTDWNKLGNTAIKEKQMLIVGEANAEAMYQPKTEPAKLNQENPVVNSVPKTEPAPIPVGTRVVKEEENKDSPAYEGAREEIPTDKPSTQTTVSTTSTTIKTTDTLEQAAGRKLTEEELALAPPVRTVLKTASSNAEEYPKVFNSYANMGLKMKKKRGAAIYLADNTSGNANLAFYDNAEVGSVLKVTNMMNNKVIYVKVVGKVPQTDAVRDVVIKLTKQGAEQLGAIDEKFLVEVASYSAN